MYRLICKTSAGMEVFDRQYDTKEEAVESLQHELELDADTGASYYTYDIQHSAGWVSIPWRRRVELL